ncbi:hypothetical protein [Sphingomonas hylomeconis]|uniref:Uncharacterized protein n=1 Tax=Sphingomonas hylomeconis TaxID=1395958 RepID=A0ABV7SYA4_9SPHN|nr:hypothetical protein [Sphingomonas hylomeconis]
MDETRIEFVQRKSKPRQKKRRLDVMPSHMLLIVTLALIACAGAFSVWYDH